MKAFVYNGDIWLRVVPSKTLFHSTMVHEVVNRGDIFAMRCRDQVLSIIPGTAQVDHIELDVPQLLPSKPTTKQRKLMEGIKIGLTD